MKTLRQILALLLVLQLQAMATESLKKSDPEVIALCDKNGDKKIKGKEYVCYLDLKKKKLHKEGDKLHEEGDKLHEENMQLQKIQELLGNK